MGAGGVDGPATGHALAGPEVIPVGSRGQIEASAGRAGFHYGVDQERRTEHELVGYAQNLGVRAEVHRQGAHHRVALVGDHPRGRVDIRQQPVAQIIELELDLLGVLSKPPHFLWGVGAVDPENRAERAPLEPSQEQLAIGRVIGSAAEKPADVGRPIGDPGHAEVRGRTRPGPCRPTTVP